MNKIIESLLMIRYWCIFTPNKKLWEDKVFHLPNPTTSG